VGRLPRCTHRSEPTLKADRETCRSRRFIRRARDPDLDCVGYGRRCASPSAIVWPRRVPP